MRTPCIRFQGRDRVDQGKREHLTQLSYDEEPRRDDTPAVRNSLRHRAIGSRTIDAEEYHEHQDQYWDYNSAKQSGDEGLRYG